MGGAYTRRLAAFNALPGPVRAGFWMTVSACAYAASGTIVRYLAVEVPVFQIVFLRNFFGLLFMLPWIARAGLGTLRTRRLRLHAVRGFFSAVNIWCLFGAVAILPVADVAAITFLMPIFASLAAIAVLGEVAERRRWTAILLGFIGALVVIRPGLEAVNMGVMLALVSAVAGAVVVILVKFLLRTEPPDTIATYTFIIHTLLGLVPALLVWRWLGWDQVLWTMALGFLAMIMHRCFNFALQAADASVVTPFNFSRLIWAALIGWLVFAELPDAWTWIGGAVIVAASVMLTRRRKASPAATG